jgi:hypothetical protein
MIRQNNALLSAESGNLFRSSLGAWGSGILGR